MPDFGEKWTWVRDLVEGGQAHTFLVKRKDGSDDTLFVLKRLKNLDRIQRFEQEIEACKKLRHRNILHIVDSGVDPKGRPFLVTEYCANGSLAQRVPAVTVPISDVLETFRQICEGAAYAQSAGIIHPDIKPENVFLRIDGTAVLGDFGICFIDDDGTRLTMTDEVAGSRFYCAPELRDGRLEANVPETAADVYSLGKVLYWMVSGGRKFDREEHRQEKFVIGRHDPGNPAYELVNQLLDAVIVADPFQRVLGAQQLLGRVHGLISVVRAGGHAITLAVPHRCMFCAQGEYVVKVDHTKPIPNRTANEQGRAMMARDQEIQRFGFTPLNSPSWIIMVCEACGHVLTFRPDLGKDAMRNWLGR